MIRYRRSLLLIVATVALAALSLPGGTGRPQAAAFDWNVLSSLDADERNLIESFRETASRYRHLSDELLRRYQPLPLRIELRRDLERLRWRLEDARQGVWTEALICPEDRTAFHDLGAALGPRSARERWVPLKGPRERLLAPAGWDGRALLVRPDGRLVRLALLN